MPENKGKEKWYAQGLRFECQRSGNCCTGNPGFVWISDNEISALALETGKSESEFRLQYTRQIGSKISLIEKANGDCFFYANGGCTVYKARPVQCRTWPFWPELLKSEKEWNEAARDCPGMGKGKIFSPKEIEKLASNHEDEE